MITSEPQEGTRVVLKQTLGKGTYFMGDGDACFFVVTVILYLLKM